jgi:hypothetical protein
MKKQTTGFIVFLLLLSLEPALGQVSFGDQFIISDQEEEAMFVYSADLDTDGDMDVLAGCFGTENLVWFENINGLGNNWSKHVIANDDDGVTAAVCADIDMDGDMDVISTFYTSAKICWFDNIDGNGTFALGQILSDSADGAISVFAADIDGDDDTDVVGASWEINQISWFDNMDGSGIFGEENVVSTSATGVSCVYCADIDNDNDQDIVAALPEADRVVWYENTDGEGYFSGENIITTSVDNVLRISVADLDNDGDMDVISASSNDDKIAWYENLDGQGSFGPQHIISNVATGAFYIYAADIDNDHDTDIVATYANIVAWYENLDGLGGFGPANIISTEAEFGHCVFSSDIDNDHDNDVLSASWGDDKIAWYKNELISSVSEPNTNPDQFNFVSVSPNPFNTTTSIRFEILHNFQIKMDIFDSFGRQIKTMRMNYSNAAYKTVIWDGTDLSGNPVPTGIYFCRIQTSNRIQMMKIIKI